MLRIRLSSRARSVPEPPPDKNPLLQGKQTLVGITLLLAAGVLVIAALGGCAGASAAAVQDAAAAPASQPVATTDAGAASSSSTLLGEARARIKHVVVIMQENRSFDSYFGTYPGADGIPMNEDGVPSVCVPDPQNGRCVEPFHDPNDRNAGGPHGQKSATADIDGGRMDGFVREAENAGKDCANVDDPACAQGTGAPEVMGYHDARELPNYWAYAENFVLQDHMFEPNASWSLPSHLFMVSGWSAECTEHDQPSSCTNELEGPDRPTDLRKQERRGNTQTSTPDYAWTDLTYLLHKNGIDWGYYVAPGTEPDCEDDEATTCVAPKQNASTPGIWNPLPYFDTVKDDDQLDNIQDVSNFYVQAQEGTLPAVSWVVPSHRDSEHPPALVSDGQEYVTGLINALMSGPDWDSTAIFLAWDDWGGFYDHVPPPQIDQNGYGLRVPGLLISPFARQGYVDHQTLSFDAYLRLIEDLFVGGQRLDPETDGRPDPRPDVREEAAQLGDLLEEFDFSGPPRPPMVLPPSGVVPRQTTGLARSEGLSSGGSSAYVVQAGDTLGEIAQSTGTTVEAIAQANCIQNPNLIFTGQELLIPASDPGP